MNPDTGHLVTAEMMEAMRKAGAVMIDGYQPLPFELERAAVLKLHGRQEAHVSLKSGGKLSMWAAKNRSKYQPHQGAKECARRLAQKERANNP